LAADRTSCSKRGHASESSSIVFGFVFPTIFFLLFFMTDPKTLQKLHDLDRTLTALSRMPQTTSGRKFPPYSAKAIAEYAKLVGQITWASNNLHSTMAWMFTQLIEPDTFTVALAVWNSVKTDSAQRDMLKAAAEGRAQLNRLKLAEQIIWLCKAANTVAAYRNDAIHTPMSAILTASGKWRASPRQLAPLARLERLDGYRYKRLFILLRGDLIELSHYANALLFRLSSLHHGRKPGPLPRKPKLQSHAFLIQVQAPKPQQAPQRKGRKAPPRSPGA
jgi:hypothetical protein